MKIAVNLRHLEKREVSLRDEVSPDEIALSSRDELIRFRGPVKYDLQIQRLEQSVLAQGRVSVTLECDCARCLRTYSTTVELPKWVAHLSLTGEEAVAVENDCVDLTPSIREDIFLALPQHPLCSKDCKGLLKERGNANKPQAGSGLSEAENSAWAGLDKLKL